MPSPLNLAILGDSVAWGQGLLQAHKYAYGVAAALGQPSKNVTMEAHSGAIIGISLDQNTTTIDPEIPAPAPKIVDQVLQFKNPDAIDVVILNGGINDIGIQTIFNPLTALDDLQSQTVQYCYYDMLALIGNAVATFTKPTCRFIITGYQTILSPMSQPITASEAGDPLLQFLAVFAPGFPAVFDRSAVVDKLIQLAQQFATGSEAALEKAVQDAIMRYDSGFAVPLAKRMGFVSSGFGDENALFASSCWIWGFGADFGPQDEVAAAREASCQLQYGNLEQFAKIPMCNVASVGHPNVAGAASFTNAIVAALNAMPVPDGNTELSQALAQPVSLPI